MKILKLIILFVFSVQFGFSQAELRCELIISNPEIVNFSVNRNDVVYRGIENTIWVKIPGINDNSILLDSNVKIKNSNIPGKFFITPGMGRDLLIEIKGVMNDGTVIIAEKKLRIKDIPIPLGIVRKESYYVKFPRDILMKSTVGVVIPDFEFDINFIVNGFKVLFPNKKIVNVSGNKFDELSILEIQELKRGDVVIIFEIKSTLKENGLYRVKNGSPIIIEIM